MRSLALVCNAVSLAFTLLVVVTDGAPTKPAYVVFGLLLVLVPLVTLLVLARPGGPSATGRPALRAGAVGNILLLASVGWALVDQHPHPNEAGFMPYAVLMLLTPALSALVLFRCGPTGRAHA